MLSSPDRAVSQARATCGATPEAALRTAGAAEARPIRPEWVRFQLAHSRFQRVHSDSGDDSHGCSLISLTGGDKWTRRPHRRPGAPPVELPPTGRASTTVHGSCRLQVSGRSGEASGEWDKPSKRSCRVDKRRDTVTPWQRLAVVIWDSQFLRVQHAVYRAAPRLATHIDELARRRDEERRKRQ
jgi:hypothetical protein